MAEQYDTPIIPGTCYRVHDLSRPQPPVVTPGTFSTQDAPGTPPSDAVVLFNGKDLSGWVDGKGEPAKWKAENGILHVVPGAGDIQTEAKLGDIQLHVEFSAPTAVKGESQGRGNSGIFLLGQYEVQVLDNYENPTYPDGTVGGLYGQYPPLANAAKKPGEWSVYDIIFTGPRFNGYKLVSPAYITVILNNIVLHNHAELQGPTQHKQLAQYTPHSKVGPLKLQDHGDLVRFRNIWVRKITGYDGVES
ncbi:MAG: DUF1080 domain-containing protein [Capsulimonadaceae bacterium]|nr:DUF1080 domain-containing protein [Capsulimonadaceae bacterium]